ncbi:hypothetical protein D8T55_22350 [Vibrio vulnificus]|nr:hypothetical protein D8T55_22350 [Vibrio vulnificus]
MHTKAKTQKTETTHRFEKQTLNFGNQAQKPVIKILIEPVEPTSRLLDNRLRQFSEFPAPKNRCPESSAKRSQLADKHKTHKPREQRKDATN